MKKEKKEHLRQQIVFHFRSEDISFVEKHYLPQNTKHLKGKKKGKKATFENDGLWPFFSSLVKQHLF